MLRRVDARFSLHRKRSAAARAVRPGGLHGIPASRATLTELRAADRAVRRSVWRDRAAFRTPALNRLSEDEVQNDANGAGCEDRKQEPQDRAHPAPLGVSVYVAEKQNISEKKHHA